MAMSASQLRSVPAQSYRKVAVGAKTPRSPAQPSRSSRCGQSVGTSMKLPRIVQTTLSWSRLSSGSEQSNQPLRAMSVWITTASRSSGDGVPGHPSTSTYRKPWYVKLGSHASDLAALERVAVDGRGARASGRVAISPSSSTSAWRSVIVVPAAPLTRMRTRPTRFWPKSTIGPAGRRDGDRDRPDLLDAADRRPRRRDKFGRFSDPAREPSPSRTSS